MPIPVRTAASTPSTAAPGYCSDPVATPSTPRVYLSSPSRGTRTLRTASAIPTRSHIHLKDVLDLDGDTEGAKFRLPVPAKRIRQLASIFEATDLEDALAIMRRTGAHLARAFDETGRATGVLFLEDIIEELVGEVDDATRR
ncbi:hypothetical protein [Rathayibacter tritici]|uniref:hypothetical protein n=1 Tax=Rathayibacter tritici TaxID=33888 RepID=UPI003D15FDA1